MSEPVKHTADVVAIATPIAVFLDAVPTVAAVMSVVWLAIRIATAVMEHRIKGQEHKLNERKLAAQDAAIKSFRDELEETLTEGVPPRFQRLLDRLN